MSAPASPLERRQGSNDGSEDLFGSMSSKDSDSLGRSRSVTEEHSKYFGSPHSRTYSVQKLKLNEDQLQNPKPHVVGKDMEEARIRGYYGLPLDQAEDQGNLVVVLMGLPARGKTFLARCLMRYLNWMGVPTRIFNFGLYRRIHLGHEHSHPKVATPEWHRMKEVLQLALDDVLGFLNGTSEAASPEEPPLKGFEEQGTSTSEEDLRSNFLYSSSMAAGSSGNIGADTSSCKIAIFDATNVTRMRRDAVREILCRDEEGLSRKRVIFLESICTDPSKIAKYGESYVAHSEFQGLPHDRAVEEFEKLIAHYEEMYEPLSEEEEAPLIRTVNVSEKVDAVDINGYLPCRILYLLMTMHAQPKMVFLFPWSEMVSPRTGDSISDVMGHVDSSIAAWNGEDLPLTVWTHTQAKLPDSMYGHEVQSWKVMTDMVDVEERDLAYEANLLEPMIIELERRKSHILVVANDPVCKVLYSYLTETLLGDVPMQSNTLVRILPGGYGVTVDRIPISPKEGPGSISAPLSAE